MNQIFTQHFLAMYYLSLAICFQNLYAWSCYDRREKGIISQGIAVFVNESSLAYIKVRIVEN